MGALSPHQACCGAGCRVLGVSLRVCPAPPVLTVFTGFYEVPAGLRRCSFLTVSSNSLHLNACLMLTGWPRCLSFGYVYALYRFLSFNFYL